MLVPVANCLRRVERLTRTKADAIKVWGGCAVVLGALVWSLASLRAPLYVNSGSNGGAGHAGHAGYVGGLASGASEHYSEIWSVRDAEFVRDTWFVLDASRLNVHRLDAEGRYLGSFGRTGRGPGELHRPRALAVRGDTVFVGASDLRLHAFGTDGTHLLDRRIEPPNRCSLSGLGDMASSRLGLLLMFTCDDGDARAVVRMETELGEYRTLAIDAAPASNKRLINPLRDMAVFTAHPHGFAFGHPEDECLGVHDLDGLRVDSVCHQWIPRHDVPTPLKQDVAALRSDAARVGVELAIPKRYPPFDRVSWNNGAPVYRTPLREAVSVSQLVAHVDSGLTHLAQAPVLIMSRGAVLAAWPDTEGTWIRVWEADGLAGRR